MAALFSGYQNAIASISATAQCKPRGPEKPIHAYFGFERKLACEALGALGPGVRDALPELRQAFDTDDVELALTARDAIRKTTSEKEAEKWCQIEPKSDLGVGERRDASAGATQLRYAMVI